MTEFRVAGVKAGYHTGESLTTREGSWSVEPRGLGLARRPSGGHGGHASTHLSVCLSVSEESETNHRIFPLSDGDRHRFFSHRRRRKLQEGATEALSPRQEFENVIMGGRGEKKDERGGACGITTG